jgi:hypothetical protein
MMQPPAWRAWVTVLERADVSIVMELKSVRLSHERNGWFESLADIP